MPTRNNQLKDLKYLCAQDLKKIISTTTSLRDRCILKTLAQTGMTPRELVNLEIRDLALGWWVWHACGWHIRIRRGQGMKPEMVFPSADLVADLKHLICNRKAGFVFTNSKGGKLTVEKINEISPCQPRKGKTMTGRQFDEIVTPALKRWYCAIQAGKRGQARKQAQLVMDMCRSITYSNVRVDEKIIRKAETFKRLFNGLRDFVVLSETMKCLGSISEDCIREVAWQWYVCWRYVVLNNYSESDVRYHKEILDWVLSKFDSLKEIFREAFGPPEYIPVLPNSSPGETRLFYYIKSYLRPNGIEVLLHYRDRWLGRQHLDLFIPILNIAFEFQLGKHHLSERGRRLDKEKMVKCIQNGVKLFYVYVGLRACPGHGYSVDVRKIIDMYLSNGDGGAESA